MDGQSVIEKDWCIRIATGDDNKIELSGINYPSLPQRYFGTTGDEQYDVKWSREPDLFWISCDRYAMFQIFYSQQKDGCVLISNSIDQLLEKGASRQLDLDALAVFVRLGYFLSEDTPFKKIRVIPPGGKLIVKPGMIELIREQATAKKQTHTPDRVTAKKQFGELFQETINSFAASHQSSDLIVPISGGRDSRHILLALNRAGVKPRHCITCEWFAPSNNEDIPPAQELCAKLGLNHQTISQSNDLFSAEVNGFHLTSYCADENNWNFPVAKYYSEITGPKMLINGIAGDILVAGLLSDEKKIEMFRHCEWTGLAEYIFAKDGLATFYLGKEWQNKLSESRALERLKGELSKYEGCANPVAEFYLWNRTVREISHIPRTYLGRFGPVATPFLTDNVFDLAINLPAEYFVNKKFHTEVISQFYPEVAGVPYAVKSTNRHLSLMIRFNLIIKSMFYMLSDRKILSRVDVRYLLPRMLKGLLSPAFGTRLHDGLVMPLYLATLSKVESRFLMSDDH